MSHADDCKYVDLPVGQACSACIYLLYFHKSRYSLKCTGEQTLGEDLRPERDKQWFYSAVWVKTSMWRLRGRAVRALDLKLGGPEFKYRPGR